MAKGFQPVSVDDLRLPNWAASDVRVIAKTGQTERIDTVEEFRRAAQFLDRLEQDIQSASSKLWDVHSVSGYKDYESGLLGPLPKEIYQRVEAIEKRGNPSELERQEKVEASDLLSKLASDLVSLRGRMMSLAGTNVEALIWTGDGIENYTIEEGKVFRYTDVGGRQEIYDGSYDSDDEQYKLGRAIKLATVGSGLWVLLEGSQTRRRFLFKKEEVATRFVAEFRRGSWFEFFRSGGQSSGQSISLSIVKPPKGLSIKDLVVTEGQIEVVFSDEKGKPSQSSTGSLREYYSPASLGSSVCCVGQIF